MKKLMIKFLATLNNVIKKKQNKICLVSFPDFSDSCMSITNYIVSRKLEKYEIVWLVDNLKIPDEVNLLKKQFKIKVRKKNTLSGIINYMTSKYVFYTHGVFNGVECLSKQIVINLWHGMPLKNICYLDNKKKEVIPHFTYTLATSEEFQNIIARAFGVEKNKVLITGLPRNDELYNFKNILNKLGISGEKYKKRLLWMPTYRHSIIGDIREDGEDNKGQLPLLQDNEIEGFNEYLKENNDLLIIKLHPMDKLLKKDFREFSNIKIITNDDFKKIGEQLYSIFQEVDALITDYSSVYFDFLLLNKPIGFIVNDLKEYKENRGFVFENIYDWIPGPIIEDMINLKNFIEQINNDKDVYENVREKVNKKVNKYSDSSNTARLFKKLGL